MSFDKYEWFRRLKEDIANIFASEHLTFWWKVGKRILEDWDKFDKPEFGRLSFRKLASDLNIPLTELSVSVRFARLYPEFNEDKRREIEDDLKKRGVLKEDEKLTWHSLVNKAIPALEKGTIIEVKTKKDEILSDIVKRFPEERVDIEEIGERLSTTALKKLKEVKIANPEVSVEEIYVRTIELEAPISVKIPKRIYYGILEDCVRTLDTSEVNVEARIAAILEEYLQSRKISREDIIKRMKKAIEAV
jgi:hypothetical protein